MFVQTLVMLLLYSASKRGPIFRVCVFFFADERGCVSVSASAPPRTAHTQCASDQRARSNNPSGLFAIAFAQRVQINNGESRSALRRTQITYYYYRTVVVCFMCVSV